ncbi:MAG: hypothetical protein KC766_08640 [Myxococcales bacterium]|nr:hypothetical protein [Myxococcales bacterium]
MSLHSFRGSRSIERVAARYLVLGALSVPLALAGCSDDESSGGSGGSGAAGSGGTGATGGSGGSSAGGSGGSGGDGSLCEKYGGANNVASVVKDNVFPAIAGDCRISAWFTSLTDNMQTHVLECLTIQTQEVFGCAGVTYAGSSSSVAPCRSMSEAHANLGISDADFDALIEDVAAGLTEAGVEAADIQAAAPVLLGLKSDIVEDTSGTNTKATCPASGGTGGTGTGGSAGTGSGGTAGAGTGGTGN